MLPPPHAEHDPSLITDSPAGSVASSNLSRATTVGGSGRGGGSGVERLLYKALRGLAEQVGSQLGSCSSSLLARLDSSPPCMHRCMPTAFSASLPAGAGRATGVCGAAGGPAVAPAGCGVHSCEAEAHPASERCRGGWRVESAGRSDPTQMQLTSQLQPACLPTCLRVHLHKCPSATLPCCTAVRLQVEQYSRKSALGAKLEQKAVKLHLLPGELEL